MAGLIFRAAAPFHWAGTVYETGDSIDSTGWSDEAIRTFTKRCPVYVDQSGTVGTGGGGGGIVTETDPVAAAALLTHETSTPAHSAAGVSFSPTGLAVVTGTNVQAALTQLDAWATARPTNENGTLANRPNLAATPRAESSTYFAIDDSLGTTYRVVGGAWAKQSGAVGDSGGRELAYTSLAATIAAANAPDNAAHDLPGLQIGFVGGIRPVKVRLSIGSAIGLGTAATGSLRRVSAYLQQVNADTSLTQRDSSSWTSIISTGNSILARLICEYRFQPVAGQAYTFKAQQGTNIAGLSLSWLGEDNGVETFIEAVER